jgi:RNase P protein component
LPSLKQSYNIIVVAKDNVTDASFDKLTLEFNKLLKKANLFYEEDT